MASKEEVLRKYGLDDRAIDGSEKFVGEKAFDATVKEIYTDIKKKANSSHKHAATDITEDESHKFVTAEQIKKIEAVTEVFKATKDSLETSDADVMAKYFTPDNPGNGKTPKAGDVFVIETNVGSLVYEYSSYIHNGSDWVAITGNVDASKVIFREDVITAGGYTQVGNVTKGATATGKIATKGKSLDFLIKNIFTKVEQPAITSQPAVSGFALSGAKAVEAGTKLESVSFGTAKLSAGSYTFGPATGITAQSYKVDRIANPVSLSKENVAAAASGTDNNDAKGFVIGDVTDAGENVVSSLKYKVTVAHNEGAVALDNMKNPSKPEVKINAGNKTQETVAYVPFRKYFYGATTGTEEVTSDIVRGLTNSTAAYKAQTLKITVPAKSARVIISCIEGVTGVTRVINKSAMNADITQNFIKSTVNVEGAGGYASKPYNTWVFKPAVPFENQAELEITLG